MFYLLRCTAVLMLASSPLLAEDSSLLSNPIVIFLTLLSIVLFIAVLFLLSRTKHQASKTKQLVGESKLEAEEAGRAKDTFLANVSHETRTPMNAIIGLSHILLQGNLTHSQKTNMLKIKRSAEMLLLITNDILDFSKIEAGKLQFEEIDFDSSEFFSNIADMVNVNAVERNLDLIFDISADIPETLRGDPLRISQVLINLLNNAMKFTNHGEVTLKVSLDETKDKNSILFEVIDTGIGLSDEQMQKLFQAFSQADNRTSRKYGGTGLGLAISKELVEMMGGQLNVKSKLREGSNFYFKIPCATAKQKKKIENNLTTRLLSNKTIVLAEQSISSCKILTNILVSHGALVKVANSASELHHLLQWNEYNAACIDSRIMAQLEHPEILNQKCDTVVLLQYEILNLPVINTVKIDSKITKPFMYLSVMRSMIEIFGKNIIQQEIKKDQITIDDLAALKGSKILLVEDNEGNRMVVEGLLEGSGIEVSHAINGQQAVEAVFDKSKQFELVLMDINMPIMDGYAATSIIREYQKYDDIPVIAMTANITESDIEKSKSFGMQGHLAKPIDVNAFYKILMQYIRPKIEEVRTRQVKKVVVTSVDGFALPGVDINDGLSRLNGNLQAYQKILLKYVDLFENVSSDLDSLIKQGRYDDAKALAHNLKGLSGNIGALEMYELAKEAEDIFSEKSTVTADIIASIEAEIKELCGAIKMKVKDVSTQRGKEGSLSIEETNELLKNLYAAAKKKKAVEIKKICLELSRHKWSSSMKTKIDHIIKQSALYKFDSVLKAIEDITVSKKG